LATNRLASSFHGMTSIFFARQLGDDRLDARAALADRRADRVEPVLA